MFGLSIDGHGITICHKYKNRTIGIQQPGFIAFYTVEEALSMIKECAEKQKGLAQQKYYWNLVLPDMNEVILKGARKGFTVLFGLEILYRSAFSNS